MHPFPLVVFLTLAAGSSSRPIPAGCREDHGTCREDCTIDYGGSTTKYRQLGECLQRCDREQNDCTSRHYSLRDAQVDPQPGSREPSVPAKPAAPAEPVPPAEPAVKPTPVAAPAPKPVMQFKPASASTKEGSSDMRVFDDPEPTPAPKPEPKPVAPSRPTSPPEPKKKDISEWDPNGD
jgi:hypothetical protein